MAINIERSREIYETRDYEQFVYEKGNRQINTAHVENIVKSMQIHGNLMDLYPIVVQEARQKKKTVFIIKDGQHRYEAAMRLRLSIYYTIDGEERLNLQTVINANAAQKSWSLRDFLGSYCMREFAEYLRFREFITLYPISISFSLRLLGSQNDKTLTHEFKRGLFKIRNWEWACLVGDTLRDFAHYYSGAYSTQFMYAVTYLLRNEDYDHSQMVHKLAMVPSTLLDKAGDADEYFRKLNEVYNYKQQKDIREFIMIDSTGRRKKGGRWVATTMEDL